MKLSIMAEKIVSLNSCQNEVVIFFRHYLLNALRLKCEMSPFLVCHRKFIFRLPLVLINASKLEPDPVSLHLGVFQVQGKVLKNELEENKNHKS